eukprot:TRINITY_DN13097_c0_g1_i1.p1 TRINITY_DN13097_c0_g1~~TRINITY_DN13097_c0_g1_i1.p1  ORF type:complete len:245 (-),score=35.53 TRINITY_DN13097_c0_g1_i1:427-1161(-)
MVLTFLSVVVLLNLQFKVQVVNGRNSHDIFAQKVAENGNYTDRFEAPIQEREILEDENFEDLDDVSLTSTPLQETAVPNEATEVEEEKEQEYLNGESNLQQQYVQKFVYESEVSMNNGVSELSSETQKDECLNACIIKCGTEKAIQDYNCSDINSTDTCNCVPGSQVDFMDKQIFESDCPNIFCKSHQATCCDIYSKDPNATCSALTTTYFYGGECDADGDGKSTNIIVQMKMAWLVIACYCPF